MAISHVGSRADTNTTTETTSATITLNFATAAADWIFVVGTNGGANADPTIGGTVVTTGGVSFSKIEGLNGGGTTTLTGIMFAGRATGDHNTQTVVLSGITNSAAACLTVLRGCNFNTPKLTSTSVLNASGTNTLSALDATGTAGAWLILGLSTDDNIASASEAATDPATITERAEHLSGGGSDTAATVCAAAMTGTGSTGALSWTNTRGAGLYQIAMAVVIQPLPVLYGHGDAASGGRVAGYTTGSNVAQAGVAVLVGHGDVASAGTAGLTVTPAGGAGVTLDGHGDVAVAGTGLALLGADLQGHGDAANTGTAGLSLAASLTGNGQAAVTGTGDLSLGADLRGDGEIAVTGTSDLALNADLAGHGDQASTGAADLTVTASTGVTLDGHGDIASAGTANLVLTADLAGHGDQASSGTAPLVLNADISGHGDTASAATADPVLTAALTGHGDQASTGTTDLVLTAALAGDGEAANTGTADLTLTAALAAHGDTSSASTGDLVLGVALAGDGEAANTGTAEAFLTAGLSGHGDAASDGTSELIKQGQVDLTGDGEIACTGSGDLVLTVALDGHGDISTTGAAGILAALVLAGHGDIATAGRAALFEAITAAVAEDAGIVRPYRHRVITLRLEFRYNAVLTVTAEVLANRHAACEGVLRARARCETRHASQLEALRSVEARLFTAKDRRLDDLEAKLGLLLLLEKGGPLMPWHITKGGGRCTASQWAVIKDSDGSTAGCHPSRKAAQKQLAALYANEGAAMSADTSTVARDNLIRANPAPAVEGRTMTGYPIVFDRWTKIDSWEGTFKERIAPGALNQTLRSARDQVKVLFNHGMDPTIGDKPLGKPAVMEPDARGLYVEVPLSETSYNEDLLALMRDGSIDGQSFRFSVVKDDWEKTDTKMPERTINELRLFEFGPVTFPAYQATTVGIRSRGDFDNWMGLDDQRRYDIAMIMAVDLGTLTREAAFGTSEDESSQRQNDSEQLEGTHSGVPTFMLRRAESVSDLLRSKLTHGSD